MSGMPAPFNMPTEILSSYLDPTSPCMNCWVNCWTPSLHTATAIALRARPPACLTEGPQKKARSNVDE